MAAVAVVALVVGLAQGVLLQQASRSARALASAATGSGGVFVASQGRVMDTRSAYQVGPYSTPMSPGVWRTVQVLGKAGVPVSGVGAVQVTVTALAGGTATGSMQLAADSSSAKALTVLDYGFEPGAYSNTAIVPIAGTANIKVEASSSTDVLVDVQGYYTAGDPAAGGYVPVTPARTLSTVSGTGVAKAQWASGSTHTVQVSGTAGVPSDASAVFVNLAVQDYSSGNGFTTVYAADQSRPNASLDYPNNATTSFGTTIPLSSTGQIKIYVYGGGPVDVWMDVVGYFDGSAASGAFTPATATVATNVSMASGTTKAIPVAGVAGVPLAGSGISAVAMGIQATTTTTSGGWLAVWASGQPQPGTSSLNLPHVASTTSNFVTSQVGSDGKVEVYNSGPDAITLTVQVQGWYTGSGAPIPNDQDQTQQNVTLQADAAGGGSWVTYQYRLGTQGSFANVPVGNVKDGNGNAPSGWPVQKSGGSFTAYTWNLRDTIKSALGVSTAPDTLVQAQACYGTSSTDTNLACGMPANVQFAQSAFGDGSATEDVGPGTLAELTGDYEIDSTDAAASTSLDGLSVGRSLTTLAPADAGVAPGSQRTDASGVFGPGWTADLAGSDAGEGDLRVTDKTSSGYLVFTDPDGGASQYAATTPVGAYPVSFAGVADAAGDGETVTKVDAATITMADPDGTVTTWKKSSAGWAVDNVDEPGSNSTSAYTTNGAGLVTRILAPVPSGVSCSAPDSTPGCRSLVLKYQTLTVYGTNVTRLQEVDLSVPQSGSSTPVAVAAYDYNSSGQLADAYDPRITPNLKTGYTYNTAGRLATLTPPGQAAFSFGYDSSGRLSTVSRPDPSGPTATTTVVYDIPTSGGAAPVPLGASTTGTWGETGDLPVTGTAVFPPTRVPAGTTPATVSSGDWPWASIDYLDVNGATVNSAAYGAGAWQIDTTQYDANGNDVWDLSAGNRAQALSPTSDTDPFVAAKSSNVDRANLLASTTEFNPLDPSQQTDTYGPTHPVTLASGSVIDAQTHVSTAYDEGAPNGDVDPNTGAGYGLATTTVTDAYNVATGADTSFPDASVTRTGYAAVNSGDTSGWTLYQPTTSTVQMGSAPSSADLVTTTRYDAAGRVIESRLPGGASGGTAQSTVTAYFTATGSGSCVSATQAGLTCSVGPAAQPSSGKPLAVKTYSYNSYGQPLTQTETFGSTGTVRTATDTYDPAGRPATQALAVTPASAGGTAIPTVTDGYDSATGLPTSKSTGSGASLVSLTTGYNNLGETTSYTDATGTTSTMGYDLDGRLTTLNDGVATTAYTYDGGGEHRGMPTSEDIGVAGSPSTFTAAYDPAGDLAAETYPNGLVATRDFDNEGDATSLSYAKSGSTWMTFTNTYNALGQVRGQTSPQSSQTFGYDGDDRLTTVQDTNASACTTRVYNFDKNSNRTSLNTYPAATGGGCTTNTTPATTSTSYDQADRDTNTGYTYDDLGRTLTVPATDAQGIGAHNGFTGNLTVGYYANDMVASQTQSTASDTFTLDPDRNRIATQTDGSTTYTNHYTGDSDSPAWTATSGTTWTRNTSGIDGDLAATVDQTGTVTLQLANLHGDIVATAADSTIATGTSSYHETTEYGVPRSASSAYSIYGYLGGSERSSNDFGGLALMGVRLYNSNTGRFLSVDPIYGGNANAYIYPADPVNNADVTGREIGRRWHFCANAGCLNIHLLRHHGGGWELHIWITNSPLDIFEAQFDITTYSAYGTRFKQVTKTDWFGSGSRIDVWTTIKIAGKASRVEDDFLVTVFAEAFGFWWWDYSAGFGEVAGFTVF